MSDYLANILVFVALVLIVLAVLKLFAKGKLKAFKPLIEELIIKAEIASQDAGLREDGINKMAEVVSSLIERLPKWVSDTLPPAVIQKFCQVVYDGLADELATRCDEYRSRWLS